MHEEGEAKNHESLDLGDQEKRVILERTRPNTRALLSQS